jgi:hypothetical protein
VGYYFLQLRVGYQTFLVCLFFDFDLSKNFEQAKSINLINQDFNNAKQYPFRLLSKYFEFKISH